MRLDRGSHRHWGPEDKGLRGAGRTRAREPWPGCKTQLSHVIRAIDLTLVGFVALLVFNFIVYSGTRAVSIKCLYLVLCLHMFKLHYNLKQLKSMWGGVRGSFFFLQKEFVH